MKNLMLVFFVMAAMAFTNETQAQTACTTAQKAACKKIAGDQSKCTPEQIAACKKTCEGKSGVRTASASAVKVVNKAPANVAGSQKTCSKAATTAEAGNANPVKLVGLELGKVDNKKTDCSKTCTKKKE